MDEFTRVPKSVITVKTMSPDYDEKPILHCRYLSLYCIVYNIYNVNNIFLLDGLLKDL